MTVPSNTKTTSKVIPAWARLWHLWRIFLPRRSITGRLLYGRVLRRYDGRGWIYKPLTSEDSDTNPTSISANGRGRYLVYRDRSRLVKFEEFVKEMMYAILAPEPDSRAGIRKGKSTA
jgi:hypothetical protein